MCVETKLRRCARKTFNDITVRHPAAAGKLVSKSSHLLLQCKLVSKSPHSLLQSRLFSKSSHSLLQGKLVSKSSHSLLQCSEFSKSSHSVLEGKLVFKLSHSLLQGKLVSKSSHSLLQGKLVSKSSHFLLQGSRLFSKSSDSLLQGRLFSKSSHSLSQGRLFSKSSHSLLQGKLVSKSSHSLLQGSEFSKSSHSVLKGKLVSKSSHSLLQSKLFFKSSHSLLQGKLSPMLVCLTAMVYLSVYFPLLHCLVLTRSRGAGGRGRVIVKATGGTSRGGSSVSRDERWDRLGNWGRSLLKNLNGVLEKRACSLDNPDDIQRMLPGRFMSEEDLLRIMPVAESRGQQYSPARRLVVPSRRLSEPIAPRTRLETQPAFDIKASNSFLGDRCGCCLTEIGYEIVEQVMDFSGQNHTVINFNNAYQFIPSGRCVYVSILS
nr:hypothetical protein BaRGS_033756 [Batillaria attramentaria]